MNLARKFPFVILGAVILLVIIVAIYIYYPANDGRTPAERRQIADACFAMLHSSLTNEVDSIKSDDPRVPKVIQALHLFSIIVDADLAVQIDCDGKPAEYLLMRAPYLTNTWILGAAGPTIRFGPREVLRVDYH